MSVSPPRHSMILCILVLFATALSSTTRLASARPNFLTDHSGSTAGGSFTRALRGVFGGWEKVDTVPDYSSETVRYGVGGRVDVEKTQVYTDKEYDADTGATTKVVTKLTGSASGKKDPQVDLTYESQGGEYTGDVASNGKEASGSIEQKYRRKDSNGGILTENVINGASDDTGENAGVKLTSTVQDCSAGVFDINCATATIGLNGQQFDGSLEQTQEYSDKTNGKSASNTNKATGSTVDPNADQQEEFTATGTQVISSKPTATASVTASGSQGVSLTTSSSSTAASRK